MGNMFELIFFSGLAISLHESSQFVIINFALFHVCKCLSKRLVKTKAKCFVEFKIFSEVCLVLNDKQN
jgi:hypothetical protein